MFFINHLPERDYRWCFSDPFSSRDIKKAPPINQRSLSYLNPPWRNDQQTIASDLSILIAQDGISTSFPTKSGEVAKASQGHDPLPFLISNCKELVQR